MSHETISIPFLSDHLFFRADLLWRFAYHGVEEAAEVGGIGAACLFGDSFYGIVGIAQKLCGHATAQKVFIVDGGLACQAFEFPIKARFAHAAHTRQKGYVKILYHVGFHIVDGGGNPAVLQVERGDEHLWCSLQALGSGDMLKDDVEQVVDVISRCLPVSSHPIVLG